MTCKYGGTNHILCDNKECIACYEKSFASNPRSKHLCNLNILNPRYIFKSSDKKYFFNCDACNHSFEISPVKITYRNQWCPFCVNKTLCDDLNCKTCFEKSFASHEKSKFFSNKNDLTARQVFKTSHNKFLLDCHQCKHSYLSQLSNVTSGDTGCPFCASKALCGNLECKTCFEKSFASHPKSKFWNKENKLRPEQVFKFCNKKILFDCNKCFHKIFILLSGITTDNNWCPYCANQRLCNDINCKMCFDKSFASVDESKYWLEEENGNLSPRNVFKSSSSKKYKLNCNFCNNIYESSPSNITAGCWCNCKKNKTEAKLYKWFQDNDYDIKKQQRYDWCKNESYLPFDFVIEPLKLIIELDGGQHFKQVSNWKPYEETQKTDIYKMQQAIKNGYSIIRLLQEDVFNDKNDWENKLKESIELITENPTCIYICSNNEYDNYKKLMPINEN